MNENLLKTIDSIDEIIEESEMSVLYALESEYSKLSMLCEYCEPEVVSYIMEADTSTTPTKKESLGKKAWRIFVAILKKIRDKSVALFNKITNNRFNKSVTGSPEKALRKVKKVPYKKGDFTDFFEIYLGEDGQSGGFKYNAKKKKNENVLYGAFVSYDDSPRRGQQGKIILGESPQKFEKYLYSN